MASSTRSNTWAVWSGVSAVALAAGLANAAGAQTAPSGSTGAERRPAGSSTVQELIVTADKRTENLQVVAGAVSAQTGANLEQNKLENLSDYAAYMPGFNVVSGGSPGQAAISIRGISPGIGSGAAVGNYIDDSPLGSSGLYARAWEFQLDLLPFDVDRLELLRGPQGTLYGANSIGGVLKYVLTTPNVSHYDAEIGADVGAIDNGRGALTTINGRVNIPIKQDEAAISLSVFDKHSPGYIDDLSTGQRGTNVVDQYGGRFAFFWRPSDQFSLKLNALYQHSKSKDNSFVSYPNLTATPQPDGTVFVGPTGGRDGRLTEIHPFLSPFTIAVQYYAATADWNPGPVEVISATSYSRTNSLQVSDDSAQFGPAFPILTKGAVPAGLALFRFGVDLDKFTEELRVVSPHDQPIAWIVGAFYTHESVINGQDIFAFDNNRNPVAAFAPYLVHARSDPKYEEGALFGDVTWHVTDKFDITGGARRSHLTQTDTVMVDGALVGGAAVHSDKGSADVTTWLADARYRLTPDVMVYVRAASGYAPGGPSLPVAGHPEIPTSVGAETLKNYEVGLKSEFWDHRALVNISAYDIEWDDIQLQAVNNGISYEANGGSATTRGFEFEGQITPTEGLKLGLNAAYTSAHLNSLSPAVQVPFLLHTQLGFVPPWTVSATADYDFALAQDWTAHIGGGIRWVDTQWATQRAVGQPAFVEPSHTVLDLNASATKGRWTVLAYAKNLGNTRAVQGAAIIQSVFGANVQEDYATLQPLTVGVGFKAKFD